MTKGERDGKFHDCVGDFLPPKAAYTLPETIRALDQAKSIGELTRHL